MHSHRRHTGALVFAALAVLASPLAAQQPTGQPAPQQDGLTIEEAINTARTGNPDMLAQRNDQRSTRAAVRAARADLYLPSANAQADFGYTGSGVQRFGSEVFGARPQYYSSGYYLGIGYELSGAKLMQPRIARAQENATARRVEGFEANMVSQVAQQYLTALQAGELAAQAEREVARTIEHERLARARLEVGAGTPLDVRRAEVQRGQAEVALLQQRNAHATEVLRLGLAMGRSIPADTRLTSTFTLFAPRWTAEQLVEMAQANNPNLASARANVSAARTGIRAARSQYLPTVSLTTGLRGSVYSAGNLDPLYQRELASTGGAFRGCQQGNRIAVLLGDPQEPCDRFDIRNPAVADSVRGVVRELNPTFPFGYERQPRSAQLSFSLPIFNGLQRERRIEEARVSAQDAELQVRMQELQLRTNVETALLSLRTAYGAAQLQEQVVQRAGEELRLAQERFRLGATSSVEVTDALTSLREAERARIDAVYNFHKSLAALEALVGRSLR
ncbi:MAG TPA: TolC family protein [Longimicrobium sp.]|nr:TolC family protein [Longimicrobium sp.]